MKKEISPYSIVLVSMILLLFLIICPFAVSVSSAQNTSSATSYMYFTNPQNDTVSVFDTSSNRFTTTIDVGKYPSGIAVSPDVKKVYVANTGSGTISVIDTSTNKVTATVKVGKSPGEIAVSPDGKNVYVVDEDENDYNIYIVDTKSNKVTNKRPVGHTHHHGITITPDGKMLYITNCLNGTVSLIDIASNTITAGVTVGDTPCRLTVTPDGTNVYVANWGSNSVSVIDTGTNKVTATVDVDNNPFEVIANPDGSKVYVVNSDGIVSVIDTDTNKVTDTVNTGYGSFAFGQFKSPNISSPTPTEESSWLEQGIAVAIVALIVFGILSFVISMLLRQPSTNLDWIIIGVVAALISAKLSPYLFGK